MRKCFALSLALLCLAGCGSPGIVGKWNMGGGGVAPGSKLVTEFMANTFTVSAEVEQAGAKIKFEFSGDYTFDGKKLKMVGKSVKLDESSLPAIAKSMAATFKSSLEKAVLTTQEGDAKLEGDTLTFTTNGQTTTFTKIK